MTEVGALPRLARWLSEPVDSAWLAAFRCLYGLTLAASMLRFLAYGWIDDFFVAPKFHFKYWLFEWVEPLPAPAMYGLFWALFALALCVAAGFAFRLSAWLFVLGFVYLQLLDVSTYLNHYYLAALLGVLLACSPAAEAFSLDARRARKSAHSVPRLWLVLLRFQVAVVYTFAGLAKAHGDWLLHAQPLSIWLAARADIPLLGLVLSQAWAASLMSWAGFLFDTSIAWLLLVPRVRPFAYALVVVFHVVTRLLFPIGMFPVIMILSALVFFPPSWPRPLLARLAARRGFRRVPASAERSSLPRPSADSSRRLPGWALGGVALYCLVQLLTPLRCFAYPGNVRWHEQGMRFSWRVMVREKNGSVTFRVRQKQSGREWQMSAHRTLTRQQEREMSGQPDLILQFAHFLRDDFERRGLGPVEVRADALVSLNGRRGVLLLDPDVDLARVSDGLRPAAWILPAPTDAPPRVRPL
jgi:vitamin K-dependent gamma-carboxylase